MLFTSFRNARRKANSFLIRHFTPNIPQSTKRFLIDFSGRICRYVLDGARGNARPTQLTKAGYCSAFHCKAAATFPGNSCTAFRMKLPHRWLPRFSALETVSTFFGWNLKFRKPTENNLTWYTVTYRIFKLVPCTVPYQYRVPTELHCTGQVITQP